mmetsp:Transcript_29596/g.54313  ORF Transcript_29596/g.54313 Transcript_29596/m.54313 type:complete len:238 (+) Transcript_29596:1676-2389(+)
MKSSLSAPQPVDDLELAPLVVVAESLLPPFAPIASCSLLPPCESLPLEPLPPATADFLIISKNPCFVLVLAPSSSFFFFPKPLPSSLTLRFSSSFAAASAATTARCFEMALNNATTPRVAIRRCARSPSISFAMARASPSYPVSSSSFEPSLLLLLFRLDFFFCFHSFSADMPAVGASGNRMAERFSTRRFCRLWRTACSSVLIFCCSRCRGVVVLERMTGLEDVDFAALASEEGGC